MSDPVIAATFDRVLKFLEKPLTPWKAGHVGTLIDVGALEWM
jgi:hypothetical protein